MIPEELTKLPQWVVSRADKIPLNPKTLREASVADPHTWGTFQQAEEARALNPDPLHIGFVLTHHDPYTIIDLDEPLDDPGRQRVEKILGAFDSYTEKSQSGKGFHIVVKGNVLHGCRRDKVEIYSQLRYMIFTGDEVFGPRRIEDCQPTLDKLYAEVNPATNAADLVEQEDVLEDEEVNDMATEAANGAKYTKLVTGDWQNDYGSQSEADFALLNILCFYSKSNSQVRRLFRYSALGKRDKAQRDSYLNYALKKIRADQYVPDVDLSTVMANITPPGPPEPLPEMPTPISAVLPDDRYFPPGLVGDLARYFFSTAVRPVREVALAGALGALSGVAGRCYNVSNTGLNQYIILLAGTGRGKEGAASGIESLFDAARTKIPVIDDFRGPGAFASGQALVRVIAERPCFVSVLGEVGLMLQNICSPNANSADVMLRRVLLDLFTKSGNGAVLASSAYADKEKNVGSVRAPSLTLLGEGTPETFYGGIGDEHIVEGLIPRFTVIEYDGERPPRNRDAFHSPDAGLVDRFCDIVAVALTCNANNSFRKVDFTDEGLAILDRLDADADALINGGDEVVAQLWNRAHLKALKLAALVSVGIDAQNPTIGGVEATWAVEFVRREITNVANRMQRGGDQFARQEADVLRLIDDYLKLPRKRKLTYRPPAATLDAPVVPLTYLTTRVRRLASFKHRTRSPRESLTSLLNALVAEGVLSQLPPDQARGEFNTGSPLFSPGDSWSGRIDSFNSPGV